MKRRQRCSTATSTHDYLKLKTQVFLPALDFPISHYFEHVSIVTTIIIRLITHFSILASWSDLLFISLFCANTHQFFKLNILLSVYLILPDSTSLPFTYRLHLQISLLYFLIKCLAHLANFIPLLISTRVVWKWS